MPRVDPQFQPTLSVLGTDLRTDSCGTANGTPVPATAVIRRSWSPGSRRSLREPASPVSEDGSPTATTTTSWPAAARAACSWRAWSSPKKEAPGSTVTSRSGRSPRSASASDPAGSANDWTQAPGWSVLSADVGDVVPVEDDLAGGDRHGAPGKPVEPPVTQGRADRRRPLPAGPATPLPEPSRHRTESTAWNGRSPAADGGVHDPFGPAAVRGTNRLCSMASDDPDHV
ncbi:hypothetical protein GCM10010269_72750 [Streptomyces humidus]|uniref:Uncharacterized protein n=1 Tax=Streptomyces humidus TaxID=52259 RepID=A0A918LA34_9ACTN|nr:hypothetical protein GCM10010269_72750 [Streptomyces humidus]